MSETDIACKTAAGLCEWQLACSPPRPWLPTQPFYITPTNRAAATLVPELMPAGLTDAKSFPEQAYRGGAIYDLAEPQKARKWLEPFVRAKFPDLLRGGEGK